MALTWQSWVRQCTADPGNPIRATKGCLGMLTGQDKRAMDAVVACYELYANSDEDGELAALAAIPVLLLAMQPKCRFLARELIAFVLDWPDRDRLWPLFAPAEAA
jgi:hypothetical protein